MEKFSPSLIDRQISWVPLGRFCSIFYVAISTFNSLSSGEILIFLSYFRKKLKILKDNHLPSVLAKSNDFQSKSEKIDFFKKGSKDFFGIFFIVWSKVSINIFSKKSHSIRILNQAVRITNCGWDNRIFEPLCTSLKDTAESHAMAVTFKDGCALKSRFPVFRWKYPCI